MGLIRLFGTLECRNINQRQMASEELSWWLIWIWEKTQSLDSQNSSVSCALTIRKESNKIKGNKTSLPFFFYPLACRQHSGQQSCSLCKRPGDKESTDPPFLSPQNKPSIAAGPRSAPVLSFLPRSGRSGRRQLLVLPCPPARTVRLSSLWSFPAIPPLEGTTPCPGSLRPGLSAGEMWRKRVNVKLWCCYCGGILSLY